jgi:predicted acetyltransferase
MEAVPERMKQRESECQSSHSKYKSNTNKIISDYFRMKNEGSPIRLVSVNEPMPTDLAIVLKELGAGDSRFQGTTFGRGECDLQTFLQECRDAEDGDKIPADRVPQSTFWLVNDCNKVVGIVRVRHRLNERLLQYGGNIGYYIHPSERGKGYGKKTLQLALAKLRQLGASRALLTVHPLNTASTQIVRANGGVPDGLGKDPLSEEIADRYWIEL